MQWASMHRPEHEIIEGDESPDLPEPKPAATLLVFDEGQGGGAPRLLMVKRAETMKFAGGAAVWPGGRVDPDDRLLAEKWAPTLDPADGAGRVAAIRETLEETGLLIGAGSAGQDPQCIADLRSAVQAEQPFSAVLEARGIVLDLSLLMPFARWIPKLNSHRRFDTRFYITRRPSGSIPLSVDMGENSALFWASAAEALGMADRGDIAVIYPTRRNLERLAQYPDFAAAADCATRHPLETISPWIERRAEDKFLVIPEGLGYPITAEAMEKISRG